MCRVQQLDQPQHVVDLPRNGIWRRKLAIEHAAGVVDGGWQVDALGQPRHFVQRAGRLCLQLDAAALHEAVHLRGTATFRPLSPVVFVALAEGISGCERLERQVRSGPLGVDLSYPYHPHVTVAHEVEEALLDRAFTELSDFEARFTVDSFTLFVHDDHSGWAPGRTFQLEAVTAR